MPPQNILSRHFEKYLHGMVLKLSGHVRNTISLLNMQKKTGGIPICGTFLAKKWIFCQFWSMFTENPLSEPCQFLKTSLWRHTLTDFHDFGINRKSRPYSIHWYQTNMLWARQFQVHKGVVTTSLGKPCYKKGLVGRGLKGLKTAFMDKLGQVWTERLFL